MSELSTYQLALMLKDDVYCIQDQISSTSVNTVSYTDDPLSIGVEDKVILFVEYKTGRIYAYTDVPRSVVEEAYAGVADLNFSWGKFIDSNVKKAGYPYSDISEDYNSIMTDVFHDKIDEGMEDVDEDY